MEHELILRGWPIVPTRTVVVETGGMVDVYSIVVVECLQ